MRELRDRCAVGRDRTKLGRRSPLHHDEVAHEGAEEARKPGTTSGGVGPNFARNITSATFHGHRLAVLTVSLSMYIDVSIIQTYAPTAGR
ncbi:hypothetical protein Y032_0030g2026 [Ancylostoma ceylanicum]|uniref:Uncharacterized protein n=1 Tax=Ancylostoma ceylanicum TaxID=53326 RepID=A0A016UR59_9BILA|nr:hypothetical protein Y032_0030g2026 [Ancylostoma ceylanicum]